MMIQQLFHTISYSITTEIYVNIKHYKTIYQTYQMLFRGLISKTLFGFSLDDLESTCQTHHGETFGEYTRGPRSIAKLVYN